MSNMCSLYMCLCFCFAHRFVWYHFSRFHVYTLIHTLFHSVWQSRGSSTLCKWHSSTSFCSWMIFHCMHRHVFLYSSVGMHLGCFHVRAIMNINGAALNFGVHVSFGIIAFSRYLLTSSVIPFFSYLQYFLAPGNIDSFSMSQLFVSGGQRFRA